MQLVMRIVGSALSLYSVIIFIRIMLSWWSGVNFGRFYELLRDITDPYLLWFRRFSFLRLGNIDLSPIAALAVLSIANNIAFVVGSAGRITLGLVLALVLQVMWSALSFVLGFFAVVIGLRLLAYFVRANTYHPFWQIIGSISEPALYRISRMLFRNRPVSFVHSMVVAIAVLAGLILLVGWGVNVLSGLLLVVPKTAF
ncbi:MAG: YggT family protein [Spirochaetaceae bacterium]|jgi:YggT family protein|nr:YggT family protein [Spirochaetaceae bacterium]